MSNVVQLSKTVIRNEADLKRFIKHHEGAAPDQMVKAINISIQLAVGSDNAAFHHRLDAGRMLLELRAGIEAEGENWWKWQRGKFNRSRKDMEKLMRLARAEDPEAAAEEERADAKARMKKVRSGANVRSNQVEHILQLIEALTDQEREQLRGQLTEIYQW
jgi:hypothetical protein